MAQVDTVWTVRYDSPYHFNDTPCAIVASTAGDVYVTGTSCVLGPTSGGDFFTVKYNAAGDSIWSQRYDGFWEDDDHAIGMLLDNSENIYVCGYTMGFDATYDYALIKYNSVGDTLWVRNLNGPWGDHDYATGFAVDDSSNVYITGYTSGAWTYNDFMTVKYNASGDTVWRRIYSHSSNKNDRAAGVVIDNNGNVYVTGRSWDYVTRDDIVIVKYDVAGNEVWVRRYNGESDSTDTGNAIALGADGGVYVAGQSWSDATGNDIVTIKYSPDGDTVWTRRYDYAGHNDSPLKVVVDNSGNAIVVGTVMATYNDYCTIKYSSSGDELWVATYNGPGGQHDVLHDAVIDDSGNIYVTGESSGLSSGNDYATIKYDCDGNEIWVARYNSTGTRNDRAYALAVDSLGYVYVTGESFGGSGSYMDYLTIKYAQSSTVEESLIHTSISDLMIMHNSIFREQIIIEYSLVEPDQCLIEIYDIQGRLLSTPLQSMVKEGVHQLIWHGCDNGGRDLPAGVYVIRFKTSNTQFTQKIIKLK